MKNNPVQFAVVREDSQIEMDIVGEFGFDRATLIGSGGCTAFCLKAFSPEIKITLIEPNLSQIALVKKKIDVLQTADQALIFKKFGVGAADNESLIECGNFESLFRQLRLFINEFILDATEIEAALRTQSAEIWTEVFAHSYWQTAFELFFSNEILTAMFTRAAIQHAPADSYPQYFRSVLEKGLLRADAPRNYFLHHIFLGKYLPDKNALPAYLADIPSNLELDFFHGFAQDYDNFAGRQMAHFSNIFDWCDESQIALITNSAAKRLGAGSVVVFRQLNNQKNLRPFFGDAFRWLETDEMLEKDRSLFYEKLEIGEKIR